MEKVRNNTYVNSELIATCIHSAIQCNTCCSMIVDTPTPCRPIHSRQWWQWVETRPMPSSSMLMVSFSGPEMARHWLATVVQTLHSVLERPQTLHLQQTSNPQGCWCFGWTQKILCYLKPAQVNLTAMFGE